MSPKLLYVSFDIVPSPKGAAVHIEQFAGALFNHFGALQLVTVSGPGHPSGNEQSCKRRLASGIDHVMLPAPGENLLDRVVNFRRFLENWLSNRHFDAVQFRSPFEGYCLARHKGRGIKRLIFEVNGLPSIELKYRYPQVAEDDVLLKKLVGQERVCLETADLVITPSQVTANLLLSRGLRADKLKVIPNAVDLDLFSYSPLPPLPGSDGLRLLYFGTLTPWQGVEQAVAALAQFNKIEKAHLSIIASGKQQQLESLQDSVNRLSLEESVTIIPTCSQAELLRQIHNSHIVLAPLTANDRNLEQGCSPFKILESMAAGRPVLASALPAVLEIAGNDPAIFLCKPGSAGALKDALLEMRDGHDLLQNAAYRARRRVEEHYDLNQTSKLLCDSYEELLNRRSMSAFS